MPTCYQLLHLLAYHLTLSHPHVVPIGRRALCAPPPPSSQTYAYVLYQAGIPIVYYGAELLMLGERDPMWTYYYEKTPLKARKNMYNFFKVLIG